MATRRSGTARYNLGTVSGRYSKKPMLVCAVKLYHRVCGLLVEACVAIGVSIGLL